MINKIKNQSINKCIDCNTISILITMRVQKLYPFSSKKCDSKAKKVFFRIFVSIEPGINPALYQPHKL